MAEKYTGGQAAHLLDHSIPVDGCEWRTVKTFEPVQKISYQVLLAYVSENFRCVYASEGLVTEIHCKLHGFVANFPREKLEVGERRMMQAIGLHMDQHDHDEWKKL